MMACMRAVIER